ncbi:MAG TPA: C25 family cysteine peptidase [Pyrinomonadaceae bacterium]|jgi:hypothetical protein
MRNIRTYLPNLFLSTRLFGVLLILFILLSVTVTAFMQDQKKPVLVETPTVMQADRAGLADSKAKPSGGAKEASASVGAEQASASVGVDTNQAPINPIKSPDGPTVFGTCDTAGAIEVESSGGTLANTPTAYATLALAFTAINGGTLHTGTITIDVCGNTTETGTAALNQVAGVTSVTISPAGGAARTISGAIAAGSPLINLNGADNVTINGLNTGGNSLTISNTTIGTTAGTGTIRFIADASNNTVTNCSILGSSTSTLATVAGTVIFSTGTTTGNDNNTISNNNIGPAGANLPSKAIMASGSSSSIENDNAMITGNNIFDFFIPTTSHSGINIITGNEGWTISNNKFYQTAARTFTTSASRYSAITITNSTGAFTISGNTIGFGAANGTGTTTISGTSNEIRGIDAPSTNPSAVTSIQGNTISGINQTSSRSSTTTDLSPFIGMALGVTGGLFNVGNITGNNIGSIDASSSIVIAETSTTASNAPVIGIYDFSFSNDNLSNNKIGTITINSGGTGTTVGFRGIFINGTSGQSVTVNNNVIGGTAAGSITDNIVGSYTVNGILNSASTTSANLSATGNIIRNMSGNSTAASTIVISGISLSPTTAGANTISQNTIHSLSNNSGTVLGAIYGMSLVMPTAANVVERNLIHSFSITSTASGCQTWGISGGSTGTTTYKNNMIRLGIDSTGASVTYPASVIGIRESGTSNVNNFYHNSVYIGGSGVLATPAASNSYAFQSTVTSGTRSVSDNIFYNARSNAVGGGIVHVAIGISTTTTGLTSNYNDLYVSGTDGAVGVFNSTVYTTIAAWRTATGKDVNSISADPLFTAPTGTAATVDLHINPATAASSPVNNAGTPIAGVTNDFDNDTRSATTPDIGADEFVVNFSSSGSGNLGAGTYDSITINSPDVVTLTGNISVATAIVVKNGATLNCGTFIVSGTATFLIEAGGTLGVGSPNGVTTSGATGNIQVTGTRTYTVGANYVYNGVAAQVTGNALSNAPNNLTINNTAGVTSSVTGLTVSGTLRVQAGTFTSASTYNIVQIDNGATLAASSGETINVSGNWTNDGAFTANSSTVRFNGGSVQTLGGNSTTTFSGLTINGAGVTMANNATANGTLTLTSGLITTGANTLTLGGSASASGASSSSYVNGNLKKIYAAPGSFTFDVGDAGYSPVTINATAGSGDVTAKAVNDFQPRIGDTTKALQRYWRLTNNGVTNADLTFNYLDGDVPGTATESNFIIFKIDGNTVATPGGSVNTATNTATITGVTSFSDWTLGEPNAPTLVKLRAFDATSENGQVMLRWQSGYEVDNLGYNLYREQNGQRTRVTRSMIAGSALLAGPRTVLTAGQPYTWFDRLPAGGASVAYYLEDVDLNGKRTLHGPITPVTGKVDRHESAQAQTKLLDQLAVDRSGGQQGWPTSGSKQRAQLNKVTNDGSGPIHQQDVSGLPGVKITVRQQGWVRVSQPELVAAGLDPNLAAPYLQLYADGYEVPMIVSANVSAKQFTASDWLEFYGQGLDTPTTNAQTYYLVVGTTVGKRIGRQSAQMMFKLRQEGDQNFSNTVERKERSIYFSGLNNGDAENFFGQIITTTAASSTLGVQHLDPTTTSAELRVTLQGVTVGGHQVNVKVNGMDAGTISFADREHPTKTFTLSPALLHEGDNDVQMVAANGEMDISLVDTLQLTYAHTYNADNNRLLFSARSGTTVNIGGFSGSNIRIMDITDPHAIKELAPSVTSNNGSFTASVQVSAVRLQGVKTLLAFVNSEVDHPAGLAKNEPSSLRSSTNGADFLIITERSFRDSVQPLAELRRSQGLQVSVVDVEDVYDEFSFGAHSPQAIRDFINRAVQGWQRAPHYLLLVGDATYDPRNYLAQGDNDLMPTKMVYAGTMETASDDWLADLDGDGIPELAVGRLPVRTSQEADTIINKIVSFSPASAGQGALLVADRNDDQNNFEAASQNVQSLLPAGTQVQVINRGNQDTGMVHNQIINGINQGPLVVNYYGHGSVGLWTGSGLLNTADAETLTNGTRLPLFTMMTCLNGFFQDVNGESMSEALLKAPQGGAIAVWASSGLTEMSRQSEMDQQLYGTVFGAQSVPLGDAVRAAKAATQDQNVRRTWVFFGDPTMRLR